METSETTAGRRVVTLEQGVQPMLSIVIPAFNEADRIGQTIERVDAFARRHHLPAELIVVDDGSADATPQIVRDAGKRNLRLLQNGRNRGKGFSVQQGILAARGRYVLFTDADLSAPIEEMDKLLDIAMRENADIVIGSRGMDVRYIERHQSRWRELGGMTFNLMVRAVLGLNLRDTQCGFKLFNRERTRKIFGKLTIFGFGFDPELLFLAKREGLSIREEPVRWSHSDGSKVRLFRDGLRMFADLVRIRWNAVKGRYS